MPPRAPVMKRNSTVPISIMSRPGSQPVRKKQIAGEAGAGLPQEQPQTHEQTPKAESGELLLDGKVGGRGRTSWRGLVPGAVRRSRSESPTPSAKGARDREGRSRTPTGREVRGTSREVTEKINVVARPHDSIVCLGLINRHHRSTTTSFFTSSPVGHRVDPTHVSHNILSSPGPPERQIDKESQLWSMTHNAEGTANRTVSSKNIW